LPQLSLGAWQLKERGIEVAAVRVWHEVKDRAAEVRQAVQELTGQVRDWLDRAAERVMDRLGPGQSELALAGGRDGREEEPDLATRLKASWEAHQGREKVQEGPAPEQERETPQDFAARLREAAAGIDPDALADRAAALREGREAEERHAAQEAAQEQERVKELERQQEIERDGLRDRGHGIER
jgi:hypothetical protein